MPLIDAEEQDVAGLEQPAPRAQGEDDRRHRQRLHELLGDADAEDAGEEVLGVRVEEPLEQDGDRDLREQRQEDEAGRRPPHPATRGGARCAGAATTPRRSRRRRGRRRCRRPARPAGGPAAGRRRARARRRPTRCAARGGAARRARGRKVPRSGSADATGRERRGGGQRGDERRDGVRRGVSRPSHRASVLSAEVPEWARRLAKQSSAPRPCALHQALAWSAVPNGWAATTTQ